MVQYYVLIIIELQLNLVVVGLDIFIMALGNKVTMMTIMIKMFMNNHNRRIMYKEVVVGDVVKTLEKSKNIIP